MQDQQRPYPDLPPMQEQRVPEGTAKHLSRLEMRPSLTQRSRRVGERIIEGGIFAIAALSIVFIFLIFFFTFREAAPIFFGDGDGQEQVASIDDYTLPGENLPPAPASSEQEVYNPETGSAPGTDSSSARKDTAAGGDTSTGGDVEVYNPETGAPPGGRAEKAELDTAEARKIVGGDYPILTHESPVKLSYLFYKTWQPNSEHPRYGIYSILIGTLKTTLIALLIATPLAILAALYTAYFAPKRLREIIKPIIELLAGFPSVVIGFVCLMTIATIVQSVLGAESRLNAFVGGIGLALAVIPIIYTITDDSLRAIPGSLREAALAVGASEWQAAYQVMLPAATPGIFAAILLGLGRAFGETMIALMATGNAGTVGWNFFDPVRTFAATIGAEMGEVQHGSPHYQLLFLLGVILFVFSFVINLITEFYIKQRLIKRFRGT